MTARALSIVALAREVEALRRSHKAYADMVGQAKTRPVKRKLAARARESFGKCMEVVRRLEGGAA